LSPAIPPCSPSPPPPPPVPPLNSPGICKPSLFFTSQDFPLPKIHVVSPSFLVSFLQGPLNQNFPLTSDWRPSDIELQLTFSQFLLLIPQGLPPIFSFFYVSVSLFSLVCSLPDFPDPKVTHAGCSPFPFTHFPMTPLRLLFRVSDLPRISFSPPHDIL